MTVGAALPPLAYTIDTLAGIGSGEVGDGGPATEAIFNEPHDVAVDEDGNIYIADTQNNRVLKVDAASGTISTLAGTGSSITTEMAFRPPRPNWLTLSALRWATTVTSTLRTWRIIASPS